MVPLLLLAACAPTPLPTDAAGPPAFVLGGDAFLPAGRSFDLAATGAPAGSFVGYVASSSVTPPYFCPAQVGCFDLTAPATVLGVTAADPTGVSAYSRGAPAQLRPFRTFHLQAASVVAGQGTFSSVHRMTAVGPDACVSNFSWPYALQGDGGDPSQTLAAYGVQLTSPNGYGLVGGDADGDPGGWSDGQQVMTPAWVLVDEGAVQLSAPAAYVGLTIARAGPGSALDVEITGTNQGSPAFVAATTVTTLPVTMTFAGPVDRLEIVQVGGDSAALAVDDLMWRDFGVGCP